MGPMIIIHSCKEREWYVNKFLIPKLTSLGIPGSMISSYVDEKGEGNQKSFIKSIGMVIDNYMEDVDSHTWHLQDDVWPANNFARVLLTYENIPGIICGFGTRPSSRGKVPGWTTVAGMYTSFQCIRIPNRLLLYFRDYLIKREMKGDLLDKWDDAHFEAFMKREAPFFPVLNLSPSIVEHVDYLIGGSIVNKDRSYIPSAIEFGDEKSMNELINKLKVYKEECENES